MRSIIIALGLLSGFSLTAQDTLSFKTGPHGGELNSVMNYKIEFVNLSHTLFCYLFSPDMTPLANKGIDGNIELFYPDNASMKLKLKKYEEYGFTAETGNHEFSYCVISFNVLNERLSSKFYNYLTIVKKGKKR